MATQSCAWLAACQVDGACAWTNAGDAIVALENASSVRGPGPGTRTRTAKKPPAASALTAPRSSVTAAGSVMSTTRMAALAKPPMVIGPGVSTVARSRSASARYVCA